ncbi:3,4-dihydroxy-2-butanone 4-phosphate synthase [compost metagenome]
MERRGHTEGSVDIAILAGMRPAAVLCELMNPDGTMTRGSDIEAYAARYRLPILTIAELVECRLALEAYQLSMTTKHSVVHGSAIAV